MAMRKPYILPEINGENCHLSNTVVPSGTLKLTDYRILLLKTPDEVIQSFPVLSISKTDALGPELKITTKLGSTFSYSFENEAHVATWQAKLEELTRNPQKPQTSFAIKFRQALAREDPKHPLLLRPVSCLLPELKSSNSLDGEMMRSEFRRMGFDKQAWQITDVNEKFDICPSYPPFHIVPKEFEPSCIREMASFRSLRRFPTVVWRSRKTGAVLLRCAQPKLTIMNYRCLDDELFVKATTEACRKSPGIRTNSRIYGLYIVDARSYLAAWMNQFRGGGSECKGYYGEDVQYMDLENQHKIRTYFQSLTVFLSLKPKTDWHKALFNTKWLELVGHLLRVASDIAYRLDEQGRCVMVHCTDGWDRTSQLCSLAEVMADPFYRTTRGFMVLIEREWLQFGHKFADRSGNGAGTSSEEERSPIFIQWLDCVFQLLSQFPHEFEFNQTFLIKLALHVYSGLFGTFLCNSRAERKAAELDQKTCSVWALLSTEQNWTLKNYLYHPTDDLRLKPEFAFERLRLWEGLYQNSLDSLAAKSEPEEQDLDYSSGAQGASDVDDSEEGDSERNDSICSLTEGFTFTGSEPIDCPGSSMRKDECCADSSFDACSQPLNGDDMAISQMTMVSDDDRPIKTLEEVAPILDPPSNEATSCLPTSEQSEDGFEPIPPVVCDGLAVHVDRSTDLLHSRHVHMVKMYKENLDLRRKLAETTCQENGSSVQTGVPSEQREEHMGLFVKPRRQARYPSQSESRVGNSTSSETSSFDVVEPAEAALVAPASYGSHSNKCNRCTSPFQTNKEASLCSVCEFWFCNKCGDYEASATDERVLRRVCYNCYKVTNLPSSAKLATRMSARSPSERSSAICFQEMTGVPSNGVQNGAGPRLQHGSLAQA